MNGLLSVLALIILILSILVLHRAVAGPQIQSSKSNILVQVPEGFSAEIPQIELGDTEVKVLTNERAILWFAVYNAALGEADYPEDIADQAVKTAFPE